MTQGSFEVPSCIGKGSTSHPARPELRSTQVQIQPAPCKPNVGRQQSAIYLILIKFCFSSCFASQQAGLHLPKGRQREGREKRGSVSGANEPAWWPSSRPHGAWLEQAQHSSVGRACLPRTSQSCYLPAEGPICLL